MTSWTVAVSIPFADAPQPAASWLLAGAAVVIVGIAKSGFGSGVGIVAVPMFLFAFPDNAEAIGALLPLLIAADILSVYHHWGTWDRPNLRVLAPGTLVGLVGGGALMWWMMGAGWPPWASDGGDAMDAAEHRLQIAVGVVCVLYVLADQVKARFASGFIYRAGYVGGSTAGFFAGVVTTVAHAAGPVITIYLLGQHLAKQRFVGTAVIYFFTVNLIKQASIYPLLGLTRVDTLWAGLWLLPLVPLGTWLGTRLNRVMSEKVFRATILVITLASGLKLIGVDRMAAWFLATVG